MEYKLALYSLRFCNFMESVLRKASIFFEVKGSEIVSEWL